jgi:hypothetical protein
MQDERARPAVMIRAADGVSRGRAGRPGLWPMPAELRRAVVALAREHGVGPTAREVGVACGGVKNRPLLARPTFAIQPPPAPRTAAP